MVSASQGPERVTRRRLSKEQRRRQLLDAAEEVFAERGHGGTTFEDIAARAQVTRPLLYGHFASVDEMYLECVRTARAELQEILITATLGGGTDARAQVRAGLTAYFQFVNERSTRWDLLYGPGGAVGPLAVQAAELRFATAEQVATLLEAVAPHLSHEDAEAFAHILSGASEQMAKWWRRNPEVPLEEIVTRMMQGVWTGVGQVIARAQDENRSDP